MKLPPLHDFDPALFAHGRALWRGPGTDAARFSPRMARSLVHRVCEASPGATLWDPFCGTGLIPSVARLFYGRSLQAVWASDLDAAVVQIAHKNLGLCHDPEIARLRLRAVRGLSGQNAKSARRWGQVERYLHRLLPRIEQAAKEPVDTQTWVGDAADLPDGDGPIYIVTDAPYDRSSALRGPPLDAIVHAWLHDGRVRGISMVTATLPTVDPADAQVERVAVRGDRWLWSARRPHGAR
ncbi:MAG: hypothetical protein AB8H79_06525 [Myxococcota bacterium]